jgi:hypothetical protein
VLKQTFPDVYKGGTIVLWFAEFDDVSALNAKVAACECADVLLVLAPVTSL